MDIVLKGDMDGIDLAEHFVRLDVPVVYLTAYADEKTLQRAKATRPFGYLLKPFTDSQLQTTVEIALNKHRTDRQTAHTWLTTKKLEAVGTLGGIARDFNNRHRHLGISPCRLRSPTEPGFARHGGRKAAQKAADVTPGADVRQGRCTCKATYGLASLLQEVVSGFG
jgi:hypothetical protein